LARFWKTALLVAGSLVILLYLRHGENQIQTSNVDTSDDTDSMAARSQPRTQPSSSPSPAFAESKNWSSATDQSPQIHDGKTQAGPSQFAGKKIEDYLDPSSVALISNENQKNQIQRFIAAKPPVLDYEAATDARGNVVRRVLFPVAPKAPAKYTRIFVEMTTYDDREKPSFDVVVADEIIVSLSEEARRLDNPEEAIESIAPGLKVTRKLGLPHNYVVSFEVASLNEYREVGDTLASSYLIGDTMPNNFGYATAAPNDFDPKLWGLRQAKADKIWDYATDCSNVLVAVLDGGIDDHPDLKDNVAATGHKSYYSIGPLDDRQGHGTHVAGTIGAVGNNGLGVVGVCWKAKLLAVKVLDQGSGTNTDIIDGMTYAVNAGAKVLNASLGGSANSSSPYPDLANFLDSHDALLVVSAGNDSKNIDNSPSTYACVQSKHIIAVAAMGEDLNLANFSNYGPINTDIAAPGVNTLSTTSNGTYGVKSGTSMASPHVAGAVALMWSQNPQMSADEIKELLYESSVPLASLNGKVAGSRFLNIEQLLKKSPPTVNVDALSSFLDGATLLTDLQYVLKEKIDAVTRMGNTVEKVEVLNELDEVLASGTSDAMFNLLIKNPDLTSIKIAIIDSAGNRVVSDLLAVKTQSQKSRDESFFSAASFTGGAIKCDILAGGKLYHSVSLDSALECQKYCNIHGPLVLGSLKAGTCQSGDKVFYDNR
jgi:subtilisin family serine protease